MKTCLICDDHALMRDALAMTVRMMYPEAQIHVADSFPAALEKTQLAWDLIISDLTMPGGQPLQGIDALIVGARQTPVLIFTASVDAVLLQSVFALGVRGYVSKAASAEVLVDAIRRVLDGSQVLPQILPIVGTPVRANGSAPRLSQRQQEITHMLAKGWSNKRIAAELGMGPATVKTHVSHVMRKLGAANRTELVTLASKSGLLG